MAVSSVTSLFPTLASNLRSVEELSSDDNGDLSHSVANRNRSLNLTETHPRATILDTALSLMCFTAPQVYDASIEVTVKTIASVLSSSVQCNVLRVGKEEALRVGGSISRQDCTEVVQACADVLEKLDDHRDLSPSLLYAVVRVAVMVSRFEYDYDLGLSSGIPDIKYSSGCTFSFAKLLGQIPKKLSVKGGEMPLRLMLWYLDSEFLKHDVSMILQEANRRPLLYLTMEFHQRTDWRSLVICLALAPAMFVETRALLHNWFLLTGLGSVLKLQNELVAVLLDIIYRPMSWGLSEEIGSKLPFSSAYFPYPHQLLRTFAGPLSWESLVYLFHKISREAYREHYDTTTSTQAKVKIKLVDHSTLWASAMNFPGWFYFACLILFSTPNIRDRFCLKCVVSAETNQLIREGGPYSTAATRFVSWLLCPTSKSHQDVLVDNLSNISASWTSKHFGSKKSNEASSDYKEVGKPSLNHQDTKYQTLVIWLREFHDTCLRYIKLVGFSSSCEVQTSQGHGSQLHSLLFRKIPIGILIGYHDFVDEAGYEILLHYAATGTVLLLPGTRPRRLKHRREKETSFKCDERFTKGDAIAGAGVVFELTDIIENMGDSLFESEEMSQKFVYTIKLKAGKYLHKCVERLIQVEDDKDDESLEMLKDMYNGMARWRLQGPDVFQDHKDLNDVFQKLRALY